VLGEAHHLAGEQFDGPAGAALGRAGACGRDEECFLRDSELALGARTGLLRESLLKITLHEAALGPVDRRAAHAEALGHGLVRHPGIGRKQDLGALELAGRMPPTADQGLELDTLGFA
jgi:hypothetical protein